MKPETLAAIERLSTAPTFREALATAVQVAARHRLMEAERGQSSGAGKTRDELARLAADLASVRQRLGDWLAHEYAEAWPAGDFDADREAVRRLESAALLALAEAPEARKRTKDALPTLAFLVVRAMDSHGLAVTSTKTGPAVELLATLAAEAGIVLSAERYSAAIRAAVKLNKSAESALT